MKNLIQRICLGVRVDNLPDGSFTVIAPSSEKAAAIMCAFGESGEVIAGVEGHEYLRELGLVQHVYAIRLGEVKVRVVSPARPPAGMFSNLHSLERVIAA